MIRLNVGSSVSIEVSQGDIDTGIHDGGKQCAIALGTMRRFRVDDVYVNGEGITIIDERGAVCELSIPTEAVDFLDRYDGNETVYPFTFNSVVESFTLARVQTSCK